jgi:long-subunit acyl-CoA synthetase (AMP-forming)
MKKTVMQRMAETVASYPDRPAMKHKQDNTWIAISWKEYEAQVQTVASALSKLGLEAGKAVVIIGGNRPEWLLANVGSIYAGGVPAGIYGTCSPDQCMYIAKHSSAQIAVVEDASQLAKFKEIRSQLPELKAMVLMDGTDGDEDVYAWADLTALAAGNPEGDLEKRIEAQNADDVCTLIYTSGTTGDPKGVMLSHDNLTFTAETVIASAGVTEKDSVVSYLPLSHIAEQVMSVYGPMASGFCCCFAENMDKLGDNLREMRPTVFLAVPRVWEKIQAKMVAAGAKNPWHLKKIAAWARRQGLKGGYADQQGQSRPFFYGLAQKLVFSKVRLKLGLDRCHLAVTSAAPISKSTLEFFLSLGIPICEVFGMSESTGPTTLSTPARYSTGKAGWALPGMELSVAPDGELLIRGRHVFKGYLNNESATIEALDDDGWLHSGDIGVINQQGFLQITDRKKDIIITSGGENIAPQMLEGKLSAIPAIAQVSIIGNGRKFLSALFTLDPEKLAEEATLAGSSATDAASAAACSKFQAYIQKQVDEVNKTLARVQTVKKFTILDNEFTIEGGELTPTMKMKRRVVGKKYADQIEGMYA